MADLPETFQCVVFAPAGKLLDCRTASVVFPAYDGLVGVWRNHMPMLCKLGLGIMTVEDTPEEDKPQPGQTFLLIDGGLAQVSHNLLTIITQDAICLKGMDAERIKKLLEKAEHKLTAGVHTAARRDYEAKKLSLLTKLAESAGAA
jgi:F-type H+-transporting ATPase subunit epsilon